jgi:leucyl aminopeptidase
MFDDVTGLDDASGGEAAGLVARGEFKAKPHDLFRLALHGWETPRALLVGAGPRGDWSVGRVTTVAVAATLAARSQGQGRVAMLLRGPVSAEIARAAAAGLVQACFDVDAYRTSPRDAAAVTELTLVAEGAGAAVVEAAARGRTLGECVNLARALSNEPGNVLTPSVMAERATAIADEVGLGIDVLDEARLTALGMRLLLAVGQGSATPPRLIVLRHEPPDAPEWPVLGLIGKGITFDTGGISIKPSESMEKMKHDMSGGSAVLGVMRAVRILGAPIKVIGLVPAAENMPGGRALKPGDIVRGASGKTVEINNTDAEGRLVLADALWYAKELGATHLVDVATLTGACVVALGKSVSGLFAAPAWWRDQVRATADAAGERVWPLPVDDDYLELLKSDYADLVNTGGRAAGAISAAMFLKEFAGGLPWAHLDVAGTAWNEDAKPYQPKGATGVAVKTLVDLAFTSGDWVRPETA